MNLSERLEAARREREGVPSIEPVALAEPVPEDAPAAWRADISEPVPCPRCGTIGEVDMVDLVRTLVRQHCGSCGTEWTLDRNGVSIS